MKKAAPKPKSEKPTVRRSRNTQLYKTTPSVQWDANSIKALREHMQMTQTQMAETLGTRQQTISEWEVGLYKPRGGMARLLTMVAEQAKFTYKVKGE